jgi:hypothetical protein
LSGAERYRRLPVPDVPGSGSAQAIGLGAGRLALCSAGEARVVSLDDGTPLWSHALSWEPARTELSASGRFALFESPHRDALEVWDVERDEQAARFGTPGTRRPIATGAFGRGSDVLLAALDLYRLEAHDLVAGSRLFSADTREPRAFAFDRLVPASDGDTVLAIGRYFSEMNDSLLVFSLERLSADAGAAARTTSSRDPFDDHAYRLAAGPGPGDEVVVFRDPDDAEEDAEDDDGSGLFGLTGLYVRRLSDGSLVERLPYAGGLASGDPLLASQRLVAAAPGGGLHLVARGSSPPEVERLDARAVAFDAGAGRVAYVDAAGELRLLELLP